MICSNSHTQCTVDGGSSSVFYLFTDIEQVFTYQEIGTSQDVDVKNQLYPTPWDFVLFLWLCAMFISQIVDTEFSMIRLVNCILSSAAYACNIVAIFVDEGRTREHLLYGRDNIFAFVYFLLAIQIFDFLNMHEVFGPWSVIIKSLVMDVVKFMVVLLMFILVFTCHMCVIYKPVYNKAQVDFPEGVTHLNIKNDFTTILKELFFACFGLSNRPTRLTAMDRNDSPAETYYIATVVFAIYQIVAIIVLINLLIAMMSDTYVKIEQRSELEWKYGRGSIIWRMTKTDSVPVPVNIFTISVKLLKLLWQSRMMCCCSNVTKLHHELSNIHGLHESDDEDADNDEEELYGQKKPKHIVKVVPWLEVVEEYKMEHYPSEANYIPGGTKDL